MFSHLAYISAADKRITEALFDIGFGKERVDALLNLQMLELPGPDDLSGVTIRPADKGDNAYLASVSHLIMDALGAVASEPEEEGETELLVSPRTISLQVGATRPEARGRGVANLLTWRGLAQARADGYEICYCVWISSNLLAARYWPRFGFQEVAYRLAKQVNPMIAWTRRR